MLFLSLLFAVSCGKTPAVEPVPVQATINFAAPSLTLSPEGGEASLRVESSARWTVSTDAQTWYSLVSPAEVYKGESLVKVSAEPNTGAAARTAVLTFTHEDTSVDLNLIQQHFTPELTLSQTEVTGEGTGGELSIRTTANAAWTLVEEDIDYWFSISPKVVAKGEGELKISFAKSYVAERREATVRFRNGSHEKTLKIVQAAGTPVAPGAYVPAGYQLVWQDDFSGTSATLKDNWRFEDWAPGHVNHELQRYVPDDRRTSFIADGVLNIVARKDGGQVISARMNSRESWQYGYVEAAIRLPKGKGTWPAFWMMPDDFSAGWPACGEIDIMEEVGVNPNYTSSSIHCTNYNHVKNTQKTAERLTTGAENEFHIYALEWTEDYIKTYVDGELLLDFRNDKAGNDATWPFNKKFYIILNLAWGGDWGGWDGVNESALPCTLQVDYVRVYKKY